MSSTQPYPKLDFIREKEGLSLGKKSKKISILKKIFLVTLIFCALLGAFFSFKVLSVGKDIFQSEENSSPFAQFKRLFFAKDKEIKGEKNGRTNVLLLGIGGEGHQGALLTDTIMVASIKYSKDKNSPPRVALISIPRDLAVPFNGIKYVKINSIYAYSKIRYANKEDKTYPGQVVSQIVSYVTGLPIHYYIKVDFEGFKQIIDSLGGIDVDVKNTFYDPMYPTENYGYQTISFKKGQTHMDGDMALKYARSRHGIVIEGEGSENSDFARARRQQQILTATKDKAFSISTVINLKKVNDVLNALGDHVRTNLKPWEMLRLAELAQQIQNEKIINKIIDNRDSNLLHALQTPAGAYILLPKNKNYDEIRKFCQNVFEENPQTNDENAAIALLNGTEISGLAKHVSQNLEKENFRIVFIGNAKNLNYEKTVIYNLSNQAPLTLQNLREKFNANVVQNNQQPSMLFEKKPEDLENLDLIVILGLDTNNYGESLAKE